jgi:anti-anti-sigma factor
MNIVTREKDKFQVIDIAGKINRLNDSLELKELVGELQEKNNHNIAINLSNVTYLDSGGVNAVVTSYNMITKKNGNLVLINPNDYVRNLLEVLGLNKIVPIYSSEEEFDNDQENY